MSDRIRRPPLDRTEPIRAWSALFGSGPGGSLTDVVSRSVELGYRVVDEYIRQGQRAAERFNERSYGPETATGDIQELGARMAQYASDFFGLWLDFMQVAMSGGALREAPPADDGARPRPAAPDNGAGRRASDAPARTRVRVALVSLRPAEVSLDLRPEAAGRPLVAQGLRTVDPAQPKLDDVVLEAGPDGELLVRIRVPGDAPPGTYNGVVVDAETSRPLGTLSVRVGAA